MGARTGGRGRGLLDFLRGLNTSVDGNAQAFGFSITVTVTYGIISTTSGNPSLPEAFGFALSAVAAFALLNLVVALLLEQRRPKGQSQRVVLVATDFLAVGAALAAAVGIRTVVNGWVLWAVAPFCAGLVYVLVQAVELALGQQEGQEDGAGDGEDSSGDG